MSTERDDMGASLKALAIFQTMRCNLAMVDAFMRNSILEAKQYKDQDLGFLGTKPGPEQMSIHNSAVTTIVVALMFQVVDNYCDIKKVNTRLKDHDLEAFLSGVERKTDFVGGMRTVRNTLFHIGSLRSWRSDKVSTFTAECDERGSVLAVMSELRQLCYDFTEKCFLGQLKIWPVSLYQQQERLEREKPDLFAKVMRGEASFEEWTAAFAETSSR